MSLGKFSALSSTLNVIEVNGKRCIEKIVSLNEKLQLNANRVLDYALIYFNKLVEAGILLPHIVMSSATNGKLQFLCEYRGDNFLQISERDGFNFLTSKGCLQQAIKIVQSAQIAKLYFDPHIKNFVFDGKNVYYVDFIPPWTDEFIKMRLSFAQKREREILSDYIECIRYDMLGYHFAADIIKTDSKFMAIMPKLYSYMRECNMIKADYEDFMKQALLIRNVEDRRVAEKVYLI